MEFLNGRTPIQALLSALPEEGDWIFNYQTKDDVITAVFCTCKSSLNMLQSNPYILMKDCTYKTNRYKMPLLDIVGVTALNSTFYVGFGFIQDEQQASYEFVLNSLHNIYLQLGLSSPRTVLTDKDQALINALSEVFSTTDLMICIWHINRNILTKARPILRKELVEILTPNDPEFQSHIDDNWKKMLGLWMHIVNAATVPEMRQAWDEFKQQYSSEVYREIIRYIENEWLDDDTARRFLHCYTNSFLHFGNAATSRNEAGHWMLKRDLQVSTNDLLNTVRSFERTVSHQHTRIQQDLADEQVTVSLKLRIPLFRDVINKISNFALQKVLATYNRHLPLGPGKEDIKPCTEIMTRTFAIPCIHMIKQYTDAQRSLSTDQFHQNWHLYPQHAVSVDPRLLVLEPSIVRTRGRPAGSANRLTQRDPSAFEIVLSQERPAE
jgi:hypothetical protein